ncbi:hypothetical protein CN878_02820 [Ochrobactrum sp. 695/2009]|nr:hypothetical protein CN881_12195 [Ochrobactrum sp. 721/2009]PJT14165.1 hypothetical protein CN880_21225 [Ochrobactrum sp. 720/2009]PJT24334.1 hypothetical protein CN879_08255 [Ochrobactrum sp. 715/2009]PJT30341.1 hypothetical protein CN878_02820 [Ochrobactrum sp. 695/2009]PJT33868.1 hypothetical protein CN877_09715 [Ochrobactrum sp. 689/2009]
MKDEKLEKEGRDFFGFTPAMSEAVERELSYYDGFCLIEVVKKAYQEVKMLDPSFSVLDKL